MSAKVDDIKHTANRYDLAAMNGATVRRTTATHRYGVNGRVLKSELEVKENGTTRTDTVKHTYSGGGARLKSTDQVGDTLVTKYDALGRPVEMINPDGTHTTITYKIGTPASFGISSTDQNFHGFCSAKIMANENGMKVVEYYDVFNRLRRHVADSGNGTHLNLTTRHNYDPQGRLTEIINPKGDTIWYAYDIWGRVQQKSQPDLGVISYAYDKLGNVRFVQNQEEANKGRVLFNQYDDLNRLVVVGEAVLGANPNRPTFEDDGYQGQGGWLYGHAYFPGFTSSTRKKDRSPQVQSGPVARVTDNMDATTLHIGAASSTTPVTTNPTLWKTPLSPLPPMWSLSQTIYKYCTLQPETTFLNESDPPKTPLFRHPVTFYPSPSGPGANFNDFEDLAKYPHFARIGVSYDSLPYRSGTIWGQFPTYAQWDSLMPSRKVRNTKGREAAVAYREHGGEPWHYAVMSYDERGRVEALVRWTENIGFDGVYYSYNAMNQVTTVRVVDVNRTYQTWYGYDANGAQVLASHPPLNGVGGDVREYVYSYRGLMRRIGTGDWESLKHDMRYRYSASGEREQKRTYWRDQHDSVVPYTWTYYLLGGNGQQLAVYHGQQTSKSSMCGDTGRRVYMYPAEYLSYGVTGTANLTTLPTKQKRYVIADHLGSPRVVLDSGGMVIGRYDYKPFGEAMTVSGAVTGVRKGYIDKEKDVESELRNTGVRQLAGPRFLSVDPKWEKYASLSPYVYSANNPLNLVDPNGAEFNFVRLEKNENGEVVRVPDPKAKILFESTLRKLEEAGVVRSQELRYLYESKDFVIDFVQVEMVHESRFFPSDPENDGRMTLRWAPYEAFEYLAPTEDGTMVSQFLSPVLVLVHEGDHAYDHVNDPNQFRRDMELVPNYAYVRPIEEKAIKAEFGVGKALSQLQYMRPNYIDYVRTYPVVGPMSNVPLK